MSTAASTTPGAASPPPTTTASPDASTAAADTTLSPSLSPRPLPTHHTYHYPTPPVSSTRMSSSSSHHAHQTPPPNEQREKKRSLDLHVPTLGLLAAVPTGAHLRTVMSPSGETPETMFHRFTSSRPDDAEHNASMSQLSPGRKRVLQDCLALFCSKPSLEILDRTWRKDASFEDPIAKCHGYEQYAPQWFAMPKAFPVSKTLSLRVLSPDPSKPNEFRWEQVQEYTTRWLGIKKEIHSLVVVTLDEEDKVVHFEDRWGGKELPARFGISALRKLNAKIVPWMVSVPKEKKAAEGSA